MNQTKTKKVNNIEEFCKLFKVNIPVNEDFDYYISTLKESDEYGLYSDLNKNINSFIELEKFVKDSGFESVNKYKMKELDRVVDFLKNTQAYKNLMEAELPKERLYTKDLFNQVEDGQILMSLDFQSANFNVLRTFDSIDNPELPYTWKELCNQLEINECLSSSKSFRQIVFGNTSPKRLQTFQHENMIKVIEYLKSNGYKEEDFVFISHDEIVLKTNNVSDAIKLDEMNEILSLVADCMPLKSTIFSMSKIKKNVFVKTIYSIVLGSKEFNTDDKYEFQEKYKTLHGVPGHKFYMYFKQYILNETPKEKDLVYFNDGELCSWIVETSGKKKANLPHYEKPKVVLTISDAMNKYSYVWKKLEKGMPDLSNEEKRRAIEIFVNTCKSCMSSDIGCVCWNDD